MKDKPREEMSRFHPHARSSLAPKLLHRLRDAAPIGTIGRYRVFLVDGELIRDLVDVDFVAGGNPSRYRYVPPGEIWIERTARASDLAPDALHEAVEATLMERARLDYDRAHELASRVERALRSRIVGGLAVPTRSFAVHIASDAFDRWLARRIARSRA